MTIVQTTARAVLAALAITSVLVLISWITGCQRVNLSKPSDKACAACYGYLINECPEIIKRDSIRDTITIELPGKTISGIGSALDPCDQLIKNRAAKDTLNKPNVPISDFTDPETGIKSETTLNTGTGKVETDIITPPKTFTGMSDKPCPCVFNDGDGNRWIKAKIGFYWNKSKWWILGIGIALILGIIAIIRLTRK